MTEFDLIRKYFTRPAPNALLGVGDDAALLKVSDDSVSYTHLTLPTNREV